MQALVWLLATILCMGLAVSPSAADDENDLGLMGTCRGFLQATQIILRQLNDPVAFSAYRDISERSYETINKTAVEHRMKPLPLPTAPEDYARRFQLLEATCLKEPSLLFREAATKTYMTMRQAAGLSNELPR